MGREVRKNKNNGQVSKITSECIAGWGGQYNTINRLKWQNELFTGEDGNNEV